MVRVTCRFGSSSTATTTIADGGTAVRDRKGPGGRGGGTARDPVGAAAAGGTAARSATSGVGQRGGHAAAAAAEIFVAAAPAALVSARCWNSLLAKGARASPRDSSALIVSVELRDRTGPTRETTGESDSDSDSDCDADDHPESPTCITILTTVGLLPDRSRSAKVLHLTPEFLHRHSLSQLDVNRQSCRVSRVSVVPLDEVVLTVQLPQNGTYLSDYKDAILSFVRSLAVVRDKARYGFSWNDSKVHLRAVSCLPVTQGSVNSSTRIVITPEQDDSPNARGEPNAELRQTLSSFASAAIPQTKGSTGLYFGIPSKKRRADFSFEFSAVLIRNALHAADALMAGGPSNSVDVIYASSDILLRLGKYHGDLVTVLNKSNNRSRICRLLGLRHVVAASKGSFLNLFIPPTTFHNFRLSTGTTNRLSILIDSVDLNKLPSAEELTIARIEGPLTSDKKALEDCLDELKNWLQESDRILHDGDIIPLILDRTKIGVISSAKKGGPPPLDLENSLPSSSDRVACFFHVASSKVSRASNKDPGPFKISSGTKVVQAGVLQIALPPSFLGYFVQNSVSLPPPRGLLPAYDELQRAVQTGLSPVSSALGLKVRILAHGSSGVGKAEAVRSVADYFGINVFEVDLHDLLGDSAAVAESLLQIRFEKAQSMAPSLLVLRHVEALSKSSGAKEDDDNGLINKLRQCMNDISCSEFMCGVIGTAGDIEKVPKTVQALFSQEIHFESPPEPARRYILQQLTASIKLSRDVDMKNLAVQTAGLVPRDLVNMVARASSLAVDRIALLVPEDTSDADILRAGVLISAADFEAAVARSKLAHADSIGAPKIPNVTWDDVGGMAHVRETLVDTIQLPLERPELFANGMKKRSGILLYGPPGTGKTLVAKAVATTFALNFLSVKGPELLNMYIGESEANVRRIFQRARDARPCVIFFDELDSVAPKRGEKGDSGGVMDRIVSQLLAELDGVGTGGDVFVIGATNRPDLLDSALLRPGRFDKLLYLGISEDHDRQRNILEALTRKFAMSPNLDLGKVARACPLRLTGADLYALCSDAMLKGIVRTISKIEARIAQLNSESEAHAHNVKKLTPQVYLEKMASPEETQVVVEEQDFMNALAELTPSVSEQDLEHYRQVQARFKV
ncbi:AAA-domain-containing protein [Zopfochytrium polystomum]|nr:AAA-domain-containing protein [Zopfochytrium polystomum]